MDETASAEWAGQVRDEISPETTELYEKFQTEMEPLVDWIRSSGDLDPTGTPTGDDVTGLIRQRARNLGYGEIGFTRLDRRYIYESRKKYLRNEVGHAICLAYEQDYADTQSIPSLTAEEAQGRAYKEQAQQSKELVKPISP